MTSTREYGRVGHWKSASRREWIAASAAFLASGCAGPPVIANSLTAARDMVSGGPDAGITRDYVENLPCATMTAKIGRGARALLVLGRYDGPDLHWLTAESEALVTRRGQLVRTAGLQRNMRDTQGLDDDPIATAGFEFEGVHARSVDLDPGGPLRRAHRIDVRILPAAKPSPFSILGTTRWR